MVGGAIGEAIHLSARQATSIASLAATNTVVVSASTSAPACSSGNDFDGRVGIRVSAIFVILIGSLFGEYFPHGPVLLVADQEYEGSVYPVFAQRNQGVNGRHWAFFICKFFGSGVIVATAFIHVC